MLKKRIIISAAFFLAFPGMLSASNHPELRWRVIDTDHFRVLFHQGEEELAREAARVAEEVHPGITGYYEYEPPGKVLIVFTDTDDYANGESSYFRSMIRITATSLDMPLRGRSDWLRNVVTHEYTHIVTLQRADMFGRHLPLLIFSALESGSGREKPGVFQYLDVAGTFVLPGSITPRWFSESTAQEGASTCGSDSWDTHRDMFLRACWKDEKLLSQNDMGSLWGKGAWEAELVYNQGFAFGIYLKDRYGQDILKRLIHEQGDGWHWNFTNTIEKVTGDDAGEVFQGWRECLEERYRKQLDKIGEEVKGEEIAGRGKLNLSPRYSPDGEWIAYLSSGGSDFLSTSLLVTPREKGGESLLVSGGVDSGAGYSPDGNSLVYSRKNLVNLKGNHFDDLYLYDFREREEYQLTRGLRASEPAWSPDGTKVAFVHNGGGTKNIWVLDFLKEDDKPVPLTDFPPGTQVYSPAFSPSGDRIAFGILGGESEDVWTIDLEGNTTPLLSGPANERDPAWMEEGRLLFSSDEGGIFDIRLLEESTGEVRRITRVATGAFQPVLDPQGGRIAFSYFTADGYRIHTVEVPRLSTGESGETGGAGGRPGEEIRVNQAGADPYPTARPESGPGENDSESRPYRFSLLPATVFPEFVYEDEQGFKGGAVMMLSDLLGKHSLLAEVLFGQSQDYSVQYLNRQWHPTIFAEAGRFVRELRWTEKRSDAENVYNLDTEWDRIQVGPQYVFWDALLVSPFYRYRTVSTEGYRDEFLYEGGEWLRYQSPRLTQKAHNFGLILWWMETAPTRDWDVHPRGGRRVLFIYDRGYTDSSRDIEESVCWRGREDTKEYRDYRYHRFFLDWTESIPLPLRSALEVNLLLGYVSRNVYFWDEFYLGGSLYFLGMGEFRTFSDLPGYPAFSVHGEILELLRLSYQVPLLKLKKQLGFIYFDTLYVSLFGDAGSAIPFDVRREHGWGELADFDNILTDIGLEIRISSSLFYSYPWGTFLRLAHGFQDLPGECGDEGTENDEQKPVRIYLGVGTGF